MTSTFMPETQVLAAANGYRGLYRLFEDSDFRMVWDHVQKKPAIFESAHAALAAAKDVVRRKLNPDLPTARAVVGEPFETDDADELQLEKWREEKIEQYARSRALVKNGKRHRQVVVERKGDRRGKIKMTEKA